MVWLNGHNTITILNRLSGADTITGDDVWYKTILTNCVWVSHINQDIIQDETILSSSVTVRIPKNPDYKEYINWKNSPDTTFTLNIGDFIILGEILEIPQDTNILDLIQKYKPNAIEIKGFKNNSNISLMPHYRIEGA